MPMVSPRHQRICERLLTVSSLRVCLKRQGQASNSSGLGCIAPLPNSGPTRGRPLSNRKKMMGRNVNPGLAEPYLIKTTLWLYSLLFALLKQGPIKLPGRIWCHILFS